MSREAPFRPDGYAAEAATLLGLYEGLSFEDVHRSILHLLPHVPGRVLDIGAGTGRDAAAFAARGHQVVAVEPTTEFRTAAATLHPSPAIEWIDDSLPGLAIMAGRRETFDIVMLTAVWMHLDRSQREQAMPRVSRLIGAGGLLCLSLRHGPVPPGRTMFDVDADETITLAEREGLVTRFIERRRPSKLAAPGVTWTRLAFAKTGGAG